MKVKKNHTEIYRIFQEYRRLRPAYDWFSRYHYRRAIFKNFLSSFSFCRMRSSRLSLSIVWVLRWVIRARKRSFSHWNNLKYVRTLPSLWSALSIISGRRLDTFDELFLWFSDEPFLLLSIRNCWSSPSFVSWSSRTFIRSFNPQDLTTKWLTSIQKRQ